MEFKYSDLLWLLVLIPLFVTYYVWAQTRRRKYALKFSSLSLVKDALGRGPGIRRHIPPALFLIAMTIMLVAMARPQSVVTLPKQEGTVILALDCSLSMRAEDLKPNRFEAARAAARSFVSRQEPSTRIGIVAFSNAAALVQAPTTDRDAALAAIDRLALQRSTAIGSGILTSLDAIFEIEDPSPRAPTNPSAVAPTPTPVPPGFHVPAIVILLTDGQNVTGPLPTVAAQRAADRGVRVYTIGVGTPQGITLGGGGPGGFGFRTYLDEATLKKVADITDAKYFHASDETALERIYQGLDTQLIIKTQRTEITALFTAVAVMFAIVASLLSLLWINRLP